MITTAFQTALSQVALDLVGAAAANQTRLVTIKPSPAHRQGASLCWQAAFGAATTPVHTETLAHVVPSGAHVSPSPTLTRKLTARLTMSSRPSGLPVLPSAPETARKSSGEPLPQLPHGAI